jgi:hypothetical protein
MWLTADKYFLIKVIQKYVKKMVNIFECSFSIKKLSSSNNVNIRYTVQQVIKILKYILSLVKNKSREYSTDM